MKKKLRLRKIQKKKLSNLDIISICKIKSINYKFDLREQLRWFKENIKPNHYHNLLYFGKLLIGYNCLRPIILNKKKKMILFDTIVLKKQYRGKGYSKKIMIKSNRVIKKNKLIGCLFCKKPMIRYYKRFGWKISSKIKSKKNQSCMIFT